MSGIGRAADVSRSASAQKLTTSVMTMKDDLRKEAARVEGKFRALDPIVVSNKPLPRKEAMERYAAQLGTRLEDIDLRIRAIDEFSNGLQKLIGDGALRHLITIERCEGCGKHDTTARISARTMSCTERGSSTPTFRALPCARRTAGDPGRSRRLSP